MSTRQPPPKVGFIDATPDAGLGPGEGLLRAGLRHPRRGGLGRAQGATRGRWNGPRRAQRLPRRAHRRRRPRSRPPQQPSLLTAGQTCLSIAKLLFLISHMMIKIHFCHGNFFLFIIGP